MCKVREVDNEVVLDTVRYEALILRVGAAKKYQHLWGEELLLANAIEVGIRINDSL